jgi:alkanesulfonate monooxygenase SsuD/methylene tetrahydromethanopterin reductase-like flavin-dependent oxidoreductase (luciferase family)
MRVSTGLPRDTSWASFRDAAREAEAAGFDELRIADHLAFGEPPYEGFTGLAALAACTERIALCIGVSTVTFRQPGLVAKLNDSLQRISGGRFRLGLGAGADTGVAEHAAYGIPYPSPGERLRMLDACATTVRRLCEEPVSLVIGSSGDRALRIVARHADEWNCGAKFLDQVQERVAALDALIAGRSRPLARSINVPLVMAPPSELDRRAYHADLGLVGDADAMIARAAELRALGFDTIWLALGRRAAFDRALELLPRLRAL